MYEEQSRDSLDLVGKNGLDVGKIFSEVYAVGDISCFCLCILSDNILI
jgi:hypothetical protein